MAVRTICVPGKIFYTNGMITTQGEAEKHVATLRRKAGVDVELHHNDTTPLEKLIVLFAKISVGVVGLGYAIGSQKKTRRKRNFDLAIGIGSAGLLIWAYLDFREIQNRKIASAELLAKKVAFYLEQNPLSQVTLVFHSQGAHIGCLALEKLAYLKDRIDVVTIGGMVNIPDHLANTVMNFQNDGDYISKVAQVFADHHPGRKIQYETKSQQTGILKPHYTEDYFENSFIQQLLKSSAQQRRYFVTTKGVFSAR